MIPPTMFLLLLLSCIWMQSQAVGSDLTPENFDSTVLQSDRVWVVKFYSAMCGSCQEFVPTWEKLKGSVDSVEFAEVSIDKQPGMKLAEKYGALEEGIPNVKIFGRSSTSEQPVTIFKGDGSTSVPKLVKMIKNTIKGATKGDDGFFRKQ